MCVAPGLLPDGRSIPCRKCWQCKENKTQDWVGRSIAQSKTSSATFSVTLTYGGGDQIRATVLTYSDVQKYFKRLRRAGYRFKFIVAGEYGTKKGRAHWHAVLFFEGAVPDHKIRQNFMCQFWTHGWSYWDNPSVPALRYVCKYILKDLDDDENQTHFAMSKKPPIGTSYFHSLAMKYVLAGVAPRDLRYRFQENINKEGKQVQHYMHDATARDFLRAFIDGWQTVYGDDRWPACDLVDDFVDKETGYYPDPVMADRRYGVRPRWLPYSDCKLAFSDKWNAYVTETKNGWFRWGPLNEEDPKGEHVWRKRETIIRWETSERYRDLQSAARQARQEALARLSKQRETEQALCARSPSNLPPHKRSLPFTVPDPGQRVLQRQELVSALKETDLALLTGMSLEHLSKRSIE